MLVVKRDKNASFSPICRPKGRRWEVAKSFRRVSLRTPVNKGKNKRGSPDPYPTLALRSAAYTGKVAYSHIRLVPHRPLWWPSLGRILAQYWSALGKVGLKREECQ